MAKHGLVSLLEVLSEVGAAGGLTDGHLIERYLTGGSRAADAAFDALVRRHGPMVQRVCQQVTGDPEDASDAFQATFLVLARSAASVRRTDRLGSWLHGVARRIAARARADAARRVRYERRAAAIRAERASAAERPEEWGELHDAIARLPVRYREPVILFYFEGLSCEAVASRLGRAQGTILSQLSRARKQLLRRLAPEGMTVAAGLPPGAFASQGRIPVLTESLLESTVRTSLSFARSRTTDTTLAPSRVLALARGGLYTMTNPISKSLAALAMLSTLSIGWVQSLARSPEPCVFAAASVSMPIGAAGQAPAAEAKTSGGAKASEFPYAVRFESGAKRFLEGDEITILEVRGTSRTIEPGHLYCIKGRYTLNSQDQATIAAYTTTTAMSSTHRMSLKVQSATVERGSGTFTLFLPMTDKGWPHVSLYPAGGGEGFGGTYFGTGDSVLEKWWETNERHRTRGR